MHLQRTQLSLEDQQKKTKQLTDIVIYRFEFLESQHIAAYWPKEGEISPLPLLQEACAVGKRCYLPVLHPVKEYQLCFVEYKPGDPLFPNAFGILEPLFDIQNVIPTQDINLVFVPLLAFDQRGRRLGTGGGYYDRTFSFLKTNHRAQKPYLLGLAYDWQGVEELPEDIWDIPLNGIVTEARYIAFVG